MPVKPEGILRDIKSANVFHHPVKAKNLNFSTLHFILSVMHRSFNSKSYC